MEIDELWRWTQDNVSDSDKKARKVGVQTKMQPFSFFYGLHLNIVVFSHSDSLRCSRCSKECQAFCHCSLRYTIRNASLHWTKVIQATVKLELQAPSLPHHCKIPSRYLEGDVPEHHSNVEDLYRQIYFETVDTVTNCIE